MLKHPLCVANILGLVLAASASHAIAASGNNSMSDYTSLYSRYQRSTTSTSSSTSTTTSTSAASTTTTVATTTTTSAAPVAGTALPAAQTCGLSNFQQELMTRINQIRASSRTCGSLTYAAAPPVAWHGKLFNAAAGHATDMASKNYFSHTSLDGRTFSQRITGAGYSWQAAGENIAAGQTTVAQVMNAWVNSPGHCANLMNKNFTEVGVSCARNDSTTYKYYWTMDLARPY